MGHFPSLNAPMSGTYYDEIEIEDMTYDKEAGTFTYPCPCGDRFIISVEDLMNGEDVAPCPSCSLKIKVVFEPETLEKIIG